MFENVAKASAVRWNNFLEISSSFASITRVILGFVRAAGRVGFGVVYTWKCVAATCVS